MREPTFLTLDAKEAFNQLRQMFTKALSLRHFDLECHIRIKNDASGYAIEGVLSQLTFNHLTFEYNTELNLTKSKTLTMFDLG